jgi:hypothetical protein
MTAEIVVQKQRRRAKVAAWIGAFAQRVTVVLISRFAGKGLAGFIQKPYRPAQLAEKLREVLGDELGGAGRLTNGASLLTKRPSRGSCIQTAAVERPTRQPGGPKVLGYP